MDLMSSFFIAASGMRAQSERIRTVAENLANSGSTATSPGGDPYRRQTISFESYFDDAVNANLVRVSNIGSDPSPFGLRYEPHHPAANEDGYVKLPNVNGLIEAADMREAQRTYEANLSVLDITRQLAARTVEILRA